MESEAARIRRLEGEVPGAVVPEGERSAVSRGDDRRVHGAGQHELRRGNLIDEGVKRLPTGKRGADDLLAPGEREDLGVAPRVEDVRNESSARTSPVGRCSVEGRTRKAESPMGTASPSLRAERLRGPRTAKISERVRFSALRPFSERMPQPQNTRRSSSASTPSRRGGKNMSSMTLPMRWRPSQRTGSGRKSSSSKNSVKKSPKVLAVSVPGQYRTSCRTTPFRRISALDTTCPPVCGRAYASRGELVKAPVSPGTRRHAPRRARSPAVGRARGSSRSAGLPGLFSVRSVTLHRGASRQPSSGTHRQPVVVGRLELRGPATPGACAHRADGDRHPCTVAHSPVPGHRVETHEDHEGEVLLPGRTVEGNLAPREGEDSRLAVDRDLAHRPAGRAGALGLTSESPGPPGSWSTRRATTVPSPSGTGPVQRGDLDHGPATGAAEDPLPFQVPQRPPPGDLGITVRTGGAPLSPRGTAGRR